MLENKHIVSRTTAEHRAHRGDTVLPDTFIAELRRWPALRPLLSEFAKRDPITFLHCTAVHFVAKRLLADLNLRGLFSTKDRMLIDNRSLGWLLHDIGKTIAALDQEDARKIIYPSQPAARSAQEKGMHWTHPVLGADLLRWWWQQTVAALPPALFEQWINLVMLHDRELIQYIDASRQYKLPAVHNTYPHDPHEAIALLLFRVSDTTAAMGLPRPHLGNGRSRDQIAEVLRVTYLPDSILQQLWPQLNDPHDLDQLAHYIIASVLDSLAELRRTYRDEQWLDPGLIVADEQFQVDTQQPTETKPHWPEKIWDRYKRRWLMVMTAMDDRGVFAH